MEFPPREIIHDEHFDAAAERVFGSAERADRALRGPLATIARHPNIDRFPTVVNTPRGPLFLFRTKKSSAFPSVAIYYTIEDDGSIVLWDLIEHIPEEWEEDDI